jgi:hypothetical protein
MAFSGLWSDAVFATYSIMKKKEMRLELLRGQMGYQI